MSGATGDIFSIFLFSNCAIVLTQLENRTPADPILFSNSSILRESIFHFFNFAQIDAHHPAAKLQNFNLQPLSFLKAQFSNSR